MFLKNRLNTLKPRFFKIKHAENNALEKSYHHVACHVFETSS